MLSPTADTVRLFLHVLAASVWVGGQIVLHGFAEMGWAGPYDWIHYQAEAAAHAVPQAPGLIAWLVTAFFDGIFGLVLGMILIPIAHYIINPLLQATVAPLMARLRGA